MTAPFCLAWFKDMMEAWVIIFRILMGLSSILLVMGFIRPVYVLWFLDRNNRLMVLKMYGSLVLIFWVLSRIGKYFLS